MSYAHLTQEQRYQIYALKKRGSTQKEIAEIIECHPSSIGRELQRNKGRKGYRPKQAQFMAQTRGSKSRQSNVRRIDDETWIQVKELLEEQQYSPEQISSCVNISHETVYQMVWRDKKAGGSLHTHLRCRKQRRKRYGSGRCRRGQIVNRRSIHDRPVRADKRQRIGDFEADTIIGAGHQQAIVTLNDRKTGLLLMKKVERKTSENVSHAIIELLTPYRGLVKTITSDNGLEFADHAKVDQALGCRSFFADAYASWQRGSNENLNGLVRQYFPKKTKFDMISDEQINEAMNKINQRPRKRFNFKSPHDLFHKEIRRIALRI